MMIRHDLLVELQPNAPPRTNRFSPLAQMVLEVLSWRFSC